MIIELTTIFAGEYRFIYSESFQTEIKYNVFINYNYNNDTKWKNINLEYLFFHMDIRLTKSFCSIFDVAFISTATFYTSDDSRYHHQFIHSALFPFVSPFVTVICIRLYEYKIDTNILCI